MRLTTKNLVRAGLLAVASFAAFLVPGPHQAAAQFTTPLNNAVSVLGSNHASGSDTLVLSAGTGTRFGSPTPEAPIRVTVASRATLVNGQIGPTSTSTIYLVTGRSGDTLSGLTATEDTIDRAYKKSDLVAATITAGLLSELQGATVDAVRKTGDPQTVTAPTTLQATTVGKATGQSVVLSSAVTTVAVASGTATLTTAAAHGYRPTDMVVVSGLATSSLNGTYPVVTTPSATTFTVTRAVADLAPTADSGTAVVTRQASIHEFKDTIGKTRTWIDPGGGITIQKDLSATPTRFGDNASISIRQTLNGILGDEVAFGIYDANYLFNESATKTGLSLQTYFLGDGSYYSGRSFIVSQDREKVSGRIAQMGGQTMVGSSGDINAPAIKSMQQLNLPGEKYRYCYAAMDAADIHPLYPAGGVYSDRGVGKTTWVVGPRGETLWGNMLNPDGDSSDPELWRLGKMWLNRTTNNLTIEGSGQTGSTTTLDLYGATNGNAVLRLGSRGNQNAMFIGSAASSTGIGQIGLGGVSYLNLYNNPIGVSGVSVAIGVDDASSVLTVDSAPSNPGVPVITARGKLGQTGDLFRAQDKDWNVLWRVNKSGYPIIKKTAAPPDADLNASEMSLWLDATPGSTKLMIKAKDSGGTVRTGSIPLSWSALAPLGRLAA